MSRLYFCPAIAPPRNIGSQHYVRIRPPLGRSDRDDAAPGLVFTYVFVPISLGTYHLALDPVAFIYSLPHLSSSWRTSPPTTPTLSPGNYPLPHDWPQTTSLLFVTITDLPAQICRTRRKLTSRLSASCVPNEARSLMIDQRCVLQRPGSTPSSSHPPAPRYDKPAPPLPHQARQGSGYGHPSPPPTGGQRPPAHNRPPATSQPPPTPAGAGDGSSSDPTLLPLFRAVDKDRKGTKDLFRIQPSLLTILSRHGPTL